MPSSQQQCDQRFTEISDHIKRDDDQGLARILNQLKRLQAQATVQRKLLSTATTLSSHPKKSALPNQLASRVRHIVKFTYEKPSRNEKRSALLQNLDCNTLKFCGLAYTVRDLLGLPDLHFEILTEYITEFVQCRELIHHLYRSDIDKALHHGSIAEKGIFQGFIKACLDSRPIGRLGVDEASVDGDSLDRDSVDEDSPEVSNEPNAVSTEPTVLMLQDSYVPLCKRRREENTDGASASTPPILIASNQRLHEWSLAGSVFRLTIDNVKEVSQSDQVGSDIFLTMPHVLRTPPFVTIPISNSLALKFASPHSPLSSGHPVL